MTINSPLSVQRSVTQLTFADQAVSSVLLAQHWTLRTLTSLAYPWLCQPSSMWINVCPHIKTLPF